MLFIYIVALLMELGGVFFVVKDVIRATVNLRQLAKDWGALDGPHNPNNWPEFKTAAIVKWATADRDMGSLRRWTPVAVLIGGVFLGFIGNAVSLYLPPG